MHDDHIKNLNNINNSFYFVTQQWEAATNDLLNFFTEAEWLLHDKPVKDYNYYYDQIVCTGELLSSTIVSYFLNEEKIPNKWIDVRDLLRTDDTFRDAVIDCSEENESTTLGRERSKYTAAVFANILNAESVTIWKDVEGVMKADPKDFPDAVNIQELSYKEVIEWLT